MKKVDYELFSRFLMPHSPAVRGEDIYFLVRRADMEENGYKSDLYVWHDGRARRLTSSGDVNSFFLTDEGVCFPALRQKKDRERAEKGVPLTVLHCLPYDGGEAQELLRLDCAATDIRPLGGGRYLFTAQYSHDYARELEKAGGDAEKAAEALKKSVAECQVIDEVPYWSNGRGYVNKLRSRLYIYENGAARALTDEFTDVYMGGLCEGRVCLVESRYTDLEPEGNRLFELDAATLERRELSVAEGAAHYDAWPLHGGRTAALVNMREKYGLNENARVYLHENGEWRCLYGGGEHSFNNSVGSDVKSGRGFDASVPCERGGGLYFLDTLGGSSHIIRVDEADGSVRAVTQPGANITDAAFYKDGFAAVMMRGKSGCELCYIGPDGEETRLTDFNTGIFEEYEYSAPQKLDFVNSLGRTIEGWVIPPAGMEPGKKYPTILDIHGGPKTVYGGCYFHEMQLWASRGFAVIFCNPTGGDGGGDEFADIRGDYGGQDFRDIMAFVDTALERCAFIDPERLGVTGGSYGGFMTNWIIGHTDRFKCAASQRSISNWVSFGNTSDIGHRFAKDQTGATPWEDLEKVWGQSPLKYADRVKTPTLFIHSEEDYRCPLPEGMQMFYALKVHGVPARMCIFKGENHELSRSGRPQNRVRRLREITEWMEKYLKDEN